MNQTKFTPGPWKFDDTWALVIGPKREEVCAIHAGAPDQTPQRQQREIAQANARLITKAPEMFEALNMLAPMIGSALGRLKTSMPQDAQMLPIIQSLLNSIQDGGGK